MGRKTILFLIARVLGAYYVYTPLPDNIEEPFWLVWIAAHVKTVTNLLCLIMTFCQDEEPIDLMLLLYQPTHRRSRCQDQTQASVLNISCPSDS
ncbi:arylacetamide deacetylase-like [Macaca nemestrina]|uniref:arylacetamide deacetylase-like n=1 Tax=Macaca nemestrina TaxID=9545 RepID=UPI0039B8B51B